ncbi:hypothetical protein [Jonesia quinghaiensis]|uniref:hypothetical protein n=1 Tax=Jonesia quinghaiensis TaxID=262806 RepID=UPI00042A4153|nr:hypothetical protein [Jonesia quinghaiensis]
MSGVYSSQLLSGPRGRRLLLELASSRNEVLEKLLIQSVAGGLDSHIRAQVIVELGRSVAAVEAEPPNEYELLLALRETVASAQYWQSPDIEDALLSQQSVAAALRPLAKAVAEVVPQWWSSDMGGQQRRVQEETAIPFSDPAAWEAAAGVQQWYRRAMAEELHSQQHDTDPEAEISGMWWSTPAHEAVPATTRSLGDLGPVGLWAQEDMSVSQHAVTWPIEIVGPSKVLEIRSAADYVKLVERYPLRMTRSRLHDWYRVTGSVDEWFIPHWGLIAKEYEAVHLSAVAYLETATRRLPIAGGSTMLAGWSPDVTYWIGNCVVGGSSPQEWEHKAVGNGDLWLAA